MNNENLKPVEKLTPFTKVVMSIGTLPSSFYSSMTYYESMVWLYEYIKNTVIPAINNNADAVEELQDAFITLKNYVEHYFDSLNVQEEINRKLDEMATDGTLTNLIKGYIDPLYQAYETEINNTITTQNNTIATQNQKILNQDNEIANFESGITTQIASMNDKIDSATSGSPKAVYDTVSDLTTDNPNHNYIYLVTEDGKWYYYDTTESDWVAGGTYQSTGLDSEIQSQIESSTILNEVLTSNTITFNDEVLKAGYEYQNITTENMQINNTHNGYIASLVKGIPVKAGDTMVIDQPVSNPLTWKLYIKQENGILYKFASWIQDHRTSQQIPMTGLLYGMFQNGTNHITANDVISKVSITRLNTLETIDNKINSVAEENLKYLKYKFSFATYNTNVDTTYFPEPSTAYRLFTTDPIYLPYDLKISFDASKTWSYKFVVAYYSSRKTYYANLTEDIGLLDAGIDVIIPKNTYAVVGIAKADNSAITFSEIIDYVNFEKIDYNYKEKNKTLLSINHRGYGTFPENTLIAYKEDYRQGFDSVETDVRKTSDGEYVLLHDPSINRVARNSDGTEIVGTVNIADITYEQALDYDFGIYKGQEFAGTKIAKLEDLLVLCRNLKLHLCMELESGALNSTDVENIIEMVHNNNMQNNCLIMSSNFGLCKNVVLTDKYIDVGFVNWNDLTEKTIMTRYNSLKTPYNRMFFVDDVTKYENHLSYYKQYNANVIVWTIDTEEGIIGADPYVNGIESDYYVASEVLANYELE